MQNDSLQKRPLDIDGLNANHYMVSVHKYGFFLCKRGTARILLGNKTYLISDKHLCIYTPNTFFQILEKSDDLDGIMQQDSVDAYYPAVSSINIKKRLLMRENPVVKISQDDELNITALSNSVNDALELPEDKRNNELLGSIHEKYLVYLRYALCLSVCEAYFSSNPVSAVPQNREDIVFNRFLVSVYEHCHKERTVQYYAGEQHLSPYYFSTIIRAKSGKSALQWIENITMTFARQYLHDSAMSIKEIAERLSFPDQSTFGRYFKHREGCSPSEYRVGLDKY
jgi:transcriptional regulator, araC family